MLSGATLPKKGTSNTTFGKFKHQSIEIVTIDVEMKHHSMNLLNGTTVGVDPNHGGGSSEEGRR